MVFDSFPCPARTHLQQLLRTKLHIEQDQAVTNVGLAAPQLQNEITNLVFQLIQHPAICDRCRFIGTAEDSPQVTQPLEMPRKYGLPLAS